MRWTLLLLLICGCGHNSGHDSFAITNGVKAAYPTAGQVWWFDDRNPFDRTYREVKILAVSNGYVRTVIATNPAEEHIFTIQELQLAFHLK